MQEGLPTKYELKLSTLPKQKFKITEEQDRFETVSRTVLNLLLLVVVDLRLK